MNTSAIPPATSTAAPLPAFIDVEASGLGRGSYPIEVGVVTATGSMYCSLVLPLPEWTHWDEAAERVHGITRPVLALHGRPAGDVARALNALMAQQTVYSDAWGNDMAWLALLFDAAELPMRFRIESSRRLLDETQMERWHPTKDAVTTELALARHRASSDARILQLTYARVKAGVAA
jgi:hypothetical protein